MNNLDLEFKKQKPKKYVVKVKRVDENYEVQDQTLLNLNEQQYKLLCKICDLDEIFSTTMGREILDYDLIKIRENFQDDSNPNAERKIAGLFDRENDEIYMWNLTQDQIDLLEWLICEYYIDSEVIGWGENNVDPNAVL